jgi:tRNA(Ile2) C34 agmatinyltransferase TiaS
MKEQNRQVQMICGTCGNSDFATEGEEHTCTDCGRAFSTDELTEANQELICNTAEEMKKDVSKQLEKELKQHLRKAFKGSKNIKIR